MSRVWDETTPENSNIFFRFGETVIPKGWQPDWTGGISKLPQDMTDKDHQEYRYWVKYRTQAICNKLK